MDIAESFLQDYLAQQIFVKPDIVLGHYSLKWDESSHGIPQKEVPELKAFLRDILPYVSGAFFTAAKELSTIIEKEVGDIKKARMVQDSFSPELLLSRRKADHAYTMQMRKDGTSIIKRIESVNVAEGPSGKQKKNNTLQLDFVVGELVFIR